MLPAGGEGLRGLGSGLYALVGAMAMALIELTVSHFAVIILRRYTGRPRGSVV